MKHKIIILLLTLPFGIGSVAGQTLRAYITAAENAFAEKDYFTAYTHFETAVGVDSNRMDLQYKLAETARLYQSYANAEIFYGNVLRSEDSDTYPESAFWLGKMQQLQGKYDPAIASYRIFVTEQPDANPALIAIAERELEAIEWAKENVQKINDSTSVERMGDHINTLFSEFGAIQREKDIYFTRLATERHSRDKKGRPVLPALMYSEVFLADEGNIAEPLDSTFNDEGLKHTAHTAFSHDGSRVYYTLCEYLNKSDIRCDLYYRDLIDSTWGESHMLPEPINAAGFTSTQPNIAFDEALGKEILYFISDRTGGTGNLDIWYSVINDANNITQPQPLIAINTTENEMAPFFHNETKTLYFSSDGLIGFGGLDIYRSLKTGSSYAKPENIGPDVNSSYHDVYYTLSGDEKAALFSSNRLGSIYFESSREACCFDVYEVSAKPVEVNLLISTYNKRTLAELPFTDIRIIERNGEVVTTDHNTGPINHITIPIKRNKNYTAIGTKEGFVADTVNFSTYGITQSVDIEKKLLLDPSDVVIQVRTFDARQRQPLPNTTVEIVDKDGGLHGRKTNPRSHIQYFGLPPANAYTVTGTRKGYRPASAPITQRDFDKDTIVVDLYLELGNLEDFLPLAIYFDNDVPDPRTQKGTTNLRYLQTYTPYYASKERFKRKYVKGLTRNEDAALEREIEVFFEDSLRKTKEEFESFLNILQQYLDEGLTFKIYLKGYTSPLASNAYNYQLGQRRIKSIQNEFAAFRSGAMQKYFDSGALEVVEKSFGEETAPSNVSDSASDTRKSIYSPAASVERRVEIIEIEK